MTPIFRWFYYVYYIFLYNALIRCLMKNSMISELPFTIFYKDFNHCSREHQRQHLFRYNLRFWVIVSKQKNILKNSYRQDHVIPTWLWPNCEKDWICQKVLDITQSVHLKSCNENCTNQSLFCLHTIFYTLVLNVLCISFPN